MRFSSCPVGEERGAQGHARCCRQEVGQGLLRDQARGGEGTERDWKVWWEDKRARSPAGRGDKPGPQSPSCRGSRPPAGAARPSLQGAEGRWPWTPSPLHSAGARRLGASSCRHVRPRGYTGAPARRPALQWALCPPWPRAGGPHRASDPSVISAERCPGLGWVYS